MPPAWSTGCLWVSVPASSCCPGPSLPCRAAATFTLEQEQEFKDFAAQPDLHQKVFDLMAPQIFGCDMVKKAIACLLFGGSRKVQPPSLSRFPPLCYRH